MLKMSGHSRPAMSSLLILSILLPFSLFISSSEACGNTVYWGRNAREGSLQDACSMPYPYYKYVVIDYLTESGVLDLDGHCDQASGSCKKFASEIKHCQDKGIKVLLSLDGSFGQYPPNLAGHLANHLYENFLSGKPEGPLGEAVLDGIDFYIQSKGSTGFWAELAKALLEYTTEKGKVYLSAAPDCGVLDQTSDAAIKTGLFDYVWPRFYDNPRCDASAGVSGLLASWKDWSSYLAENSPHSQLFMGLPASPHAASTGYLDPSGDELVPKVFRALWNTPNYGGLMVWNRFHDIINAYSVRVAWVSCNPLPSGSRLHKDSLISQVV